MNGEVQRDARINLFDPFEPYRKMRDAYLENAAELMVSVVNTEAYAQFTGVMLDTYLTWTAPFREALEQTMTQTLAQLSMPSRREVASIAERCTHLEMKLDDIDAKLDEIVQALRGATHGARVA